MAEQPQKNMDTHTHPHTHQAGIWTSGSASSLTASTSETAAEVPQTSRADEI